MVGTQGRITWPSGASTPVGKVLCLCRNFVLHAREMGGHVPQEPVFFLKPGTAVLDGDGEVPLPRWTRKAHYEVELAVLVGDRARDVGYAEAAALVAGYGCLLDITARNRQDEAKKRGLPWSMAKGADGFAPISPFSSAEGLDPNGLDLRLLVNGEVRQVGNTREMIFDVPEVLSYLSGVMTLEPGDVVAMGTPEGVGEVRIGDLIRGEVTGPNGPIGAVEARIADRGDGPNWRRPGREG